MRSGHAAIQLARWSGARVITTVSSPEKAALATAAGAHHVVNYTRGRHRRRRSARVAPDGVDLVVEVSPARNAELNASVIANHGTISVYATDGGAEMTIDVRRHFALNVRYQFLLLYTVGDAPLAAAAADIGRALADGALDVGEQAGLPLTRVPARTRRGGARRRRGRHRRQGAHRRGGADERLIPPRGGCRGVP